MDAQLINLMVCPICKGRLLLARDRASLICRADKLGYPIRDDIPVMLETEARILSAEELTHETT